MKSDLHIKAWVYILRCSDREYSTYTGFSTNLAQRIRLHQIGYFKRAYTAYKRPVRLLGAVPMPERRAALRLERRIKHMSKLQKFAFLWGDRDLYDFWATSEANRRRKLRMWQRQGERPAWYREADALTYLVTRAAFYLGRNLTGIPELVERWTGVRPVEVGEGGPCLETPI